MINIQTLNDNDTHYLGVYINGELVANTSSGYFDEIIDSIVSKLQSLGFDISYDHYTIEDYDEFENIWIQGEGYPEKYPFL